MALRDQIPESKAQFPDPIFGVNLRSADDDLQPGEARKMQNLVFDGGTRSRTGSIYLNPSGISYGAFGIKGGHKYYFGGSSPQSQRLIAYDTKISKIAGTGVETVLNSGMTSNRDTFFTTWSITDKVYIGNNVDTLRSYDANTDTFEVVSGTNIPVARTGVFPILDRLMCITTNGIERTDPRNPTIWSSNSSWATLRPSLVGLFTHATPFTIRGTDTFYSGLIAFQSNAYYLITGTNFGSDVTTATASTGEDAAIKLLDSKVGTSSPYSVCSVPGVGLFWFTSDFNVFWLQDGSLTGQYIGDKIQSTQASPSGIEATNPAALSQVWMTYQYPFLMLGVPMGSGLYSTQQWWLDVRRFPKDVVWYGPMTGQSISRAWAENQNGDNAIYAGEGNPLTGAFVYQLRVDGNFTDADGATVTDITRNYKTPFPSFGWPSRQKYLSHINFDLYQPTGSAICNLRDLDHTIATDLPITAV
jgi:hypothetical protein